MNERHLGTLSAATSLVNISIGGNDSGFSNVMLNCAPYYFTCGSAISEANEFVKNELPGLLETTYKDIRARATTAKVIVLAYPKLFTKKARHAMSTSSVGQREENERIGRKVLGMAQRTIESAVESYHPNVAGQAEFTSLIEVVL